MQRASVKNDARFAPLIRRPPLLYRRAALATTGEKWIENVPFPVCQIAPTQGCLLP
jgi:hypothetical protein